MTEMSTRKKITLACMEKWLQTGLKTPSYLADLYIHVSSTFTMHDAHIIHN